MKKAVLVAFDQFTDIDIFLPWDLLNRVKFRHKTFEVKLQAQQFHTHRFAASTWQHMGVLKNAMMQTWYFLAAAQAPER